MGAVIGLTGGALIVLLALFFAVVPHVEPPLLVGPEQTVDNTIMKTYTLISSDGEKAAIMSNKPLEELIRELDQLALDDEFNKTCTS